MALRARMTSSGSISGNPCPWPSRVRCAGTAQRASGATASPASTMLSSPISPWALIRGCEMQDLADRRRKKPSHVPRQRRKACGLDRPSRQTIHCRRIAWDERYPLGRVQSTCRSFRDQRGLGEHDQRGGRGDQRHLGQAVDDLVPCLETAPVLAHGKGDAEQLADQPDLVALLVGRTGGCHHGFA